MDDLILDVSKYQFEHPGGRYLLSDTIGRDISKYFYGGYTHEVGYALHAHSQIAKEILQSITIGKMNSIQRGGEAVEFEARVTGKEQLLGSTATSVFKFTTDVALQDIDAVGRMGQHYLVSDGSIHR